MSQTIRRKILDAMKAAALNSTTLAGAVYRSRTAAVASKESTVLIIRPADETVNSRNDVAERDFHVQFLFIGHGDVPDDECEDALAEVHALICADPSFGGLAAMLFEDSSHWSFVDADQTTCQLEVRYRVRLYTPENDLTKNIM